jgi:hypothetical protein
MTGARAKRFCGALDPRVFSHQTLFLCFRHKLAENGNGEFARLFRIGNEADGCPQPRHVRWACSYLGERSLASLVGSAAAYGSQIEAGAGDEGL